MIDTEHSTTSSSNEEDEAARLNKSEFLDVMMMENQEQPPSCSADLGMIVITLD